MSRLIRDQRRLRRVRSNLRTAPLWLTPRLVDRMIQFADMLGGEPQPAPAQPSTTPIKLPRVVPTIGAIEVKAVKVEERPAPIVQAEKLEPTRSRPAKPESWETGGVVNAFRFKLRDDTAASVPATAADSSAATDSRGLKGRVVAVDEYASLAGRDTASQKPVCRAQPRELARIVTLPPTPRAPRKPVPLGWVEKRMAQSEAAIAFLRSKGFALVRVLHYQTNEPTGRFNVSGYHGEFDRTQLLELAVSRGFEQ